MSKKHKPIKSAKWKAADVMNEINVTPLVDVMLVLLIIFMIVTPTLLRGFEAQLPEGQNLKERPDDQSRAEFGIDINGDYYLNKAPIRKEDALSLLITEFNSHPDDKVLFLKADKRLAYGEIVTLMEIARDAGVRLVAAVSESTLDEDGDN
jgi:biopolymer transport protein ExbD